MTGDILLNERQDSVLDYDENLVILIAAITAFIGQWISIALLGKGIIVKLLGLLIELAIADLGS